MRNVSFIILSVTLLLCASNSRADGMVIDKIYHPYVQPMEQEFEWRGVFQDRQPGVPDNLQLQRFAYGRSLNDRWFVEVYLLASGSAEQSFDLKAYEAEAKWQLTEQGEYWADWGLIFELEKEHQENLWEFTTGVLVEKEWGKWSGTANLLLLNEWGSGISNEWETRLGLQARYRYKRTFEPAVEYYGGENTHGLGPAFMGQFAMGRGLQLRWEAGVIFGLDDKSPNRTFRFDLELEF